MPRHHFDDMDEMVEDYEMGDVEDDMYEEFQGRAMGYLDSEDEEYDPLNGRANDISSAQARKGKDIQGIPWSTLSITRERYRQTRLEQYKSYENVPNSGEESEKGCKPTEKGGMYYEFQRNTRSVKSTIFHFQLRNLVWATSKHDVFLTSHYSVLHWSALNGEKYEVINVSGHVAPCEKHPGSLLEGFSQTQVSTLAVKDNLLVAGGFQGELICKFLDREGKGLAFAAEQHMMIMPSPMLWRFMKVQVGLFVSCLQIMTVEYETLIWRSFSFASIFAFHGL